jgi:hypothetical protein
LAGGDGDFPVKAIIQNSAMDLFGFNPQTLGAKTTPVLIRKYDEDAFGK